MFLEMVEDAPFRLDQDRLMQDVLAAPRLRLAALGARHDRGGNGCFWDLKPDHRSGEAFWA